MNATSAVSVAFDPLLGWTVLAVLGGIGLVLVLLGLRAGARGTWWRLGSLIVVLAALSNPSLIEEQRKPIADVALVVVDDSDSMAIGERRQQVQAARETLEAQARPAGRTRSARGGAAAGAYPARQRTAGRHAPDRDHALGPCRSAAGTTGRRGPADRRPGARRAGRPAARAGRRAAARLDRRQEERARPADRAGAVAALRRGRPRGHHQVPDRGSGGRHRAGHPVGGRQRGATARRADRQVGRAPHHGGQSRRQRGRARGGARPQRAHARQQPRPLHHQRRARSAARAAGVGRALPGRARVAQPAEERSRGRPRALHHPAHAAEGRLHAGARAQR